MSHNYDLRFTFLGVKPEDQDTAIESFHPGCWSIAAEGWDNGVLWAEGYDRTHGMVTLVSLRCVIEQRVTKAVGYPVIVALTGTDQDGYRIPPLETQPGGLDTGPRPIGGPVEVLPGGPPCGICIECDP